MAGMMCKSKTPNPLIPSLIPSPPFNLQTRDGPLEFGNARVANLGIAWQIQFSQL